jgi:naphthalene 1,2-dioxygenase system ferredoxin subunit
MRGPSPCEPNVSRVSDSGWTRLTVRGSLGPTHAALGTGGGREFALCLVAGQIYATGNICTHAEVRLCDGQVDGFELFCPWHSGSFDVRDGNAVAWPCIDPIDVYPAKLEAGEVYVRIPDESDEHDAIL